MKRTKALKKTSQLCFIPLYHPSLQQSPSPLIQHDNSDMFSQGREHLSKCYDDCQESHISKYYDIRNL